MNIINQVRRKARIVEEVCDTRYLQAAQEAEYHVPQTDTDYPVYLTVKVQVKVAFVWVTVWAESCDITDGDTRPHIVKRANRLHRILEGKEHG